MRGRGESMNEVPLPGISRSCACNRCFHGSGTILPSDSQSCIYRPPPVYDVWHQKFIQNDGITHTYNPAFPYDNVTNKGNTYDNAPVPGYRLVTYTFPLFIKKSVLSEVYQL